MNVVLVLYIIFVLLISFLFFFGNPNGDGINGFISRFFLRQLPSACRSLIFSIPIVGPCCLNNTKKTYDYVVNQKNPLMQLFYILLVAGGTFLYHIKYSHLVPNLVLGPEHTVLPYLFLSMVMYTFYKASYSNAGVITSKNLEIYDHHKYDGFFYVKADCKTCKTRKLARSKHCGFCNTCVAKFDHHCPWINNCVGEENYKDFLIFLATTLFYLIYATFVLSSILFSEVLRSNILTNRYFLNRVTGAKVAFSYTLLVQYLFHHYTLVCMLLTLCFVMSFVLLAFIGYHLYLVSSGLTTNETAKWDDVKHFYRHKDRLIENCKKKIQSMKNEGKEVRNLTPEELLNPEKAPSFQARMPIEFPETKPENIYNFGIRENFKRVFFPWMFQNKLIKRTPKQKKKKKRR
eukprot:maker-scaffold_2-snap-gene-24.37-mRNA-1 protein AED:0.23 eAED:0.23 QI:113/1/1/1/1/1/3/86/403